MTALRPLPVDPRLPCCGAPARTGWDTHASWCHTAASVRWLAAHPDPALPSAPVPAVERGAAADASLPRLASAIPDWPGWSCACSSSLYGCQVHGPTPRDRAIACDYVGSCGNETFALDRLCDGCRAVLSEQTGGA